MTFHIMMKQFRQVSVNIIKRKTRFHSDEQYMINFGNWLCPIEQIQHEVYVCVGLRVFMFEMPRYRVGSQAHKLM